MPPHDLLTELGPLAFATRLRRLADRLSRDVSHIYEQLDVTFEARWFAVLYLLTQESALPLTTVAHRLGLTHPAINQVAAEMTRAGLLLSGRDKADSRKRLLRLSKKGYAVADSLRPVWKDVADATSELLRQHADSFMAHLDALERALDDTEMFDRVMARINNRLMTAIEIIPYSPQLQSHYDDLNYDWLKHVPGSDVAGDHAPAATIIDHGGAIFFARLDGEIVGCVAVARRDDITFELARLAVTPKAHAHQAGRKLCLEVVGWADAHGVGSIVLHTSPKLIAAISLYESLGFVRSYDPAATRRRHAETVTMVRTQSKSVTA